jgi:hypothetical protein
MESNAPAGTAGRRTVLRGLSIFSAMLAVFLVGTPVGAAAADRGPARIVLVSKTTSARVTDKPPKGPSAGDRTHETSRLFNGVPQFGKRTGAAVGRDEATTLLRSITNQTMTGVAHLPGGTLVIQGRLRRDPARGGLVVPVTRGTGEYAGARGTVWIVLVRNPVRTLNVYELKYGAR